MITLQERRAAWSRPGAAVGDPEVPVVLRDGMLLDADLDRFLLDLPINGVRSCHSLRAYGYDIMTWARFLDQVRGISLWQASRADVAAYHRARRGGDATARIAARSWNRAVAALDRLYLWAVEQGLTAASPFSYRQALRQTARGGGRVWVAVRNTSYERAAERPEVCPIALEDYVRFRDTGLRGLAADGRHRQGARDRNGTRNALFADLLVTTGLRLEEASSLLAVEVEAALAACAGTDAQQVPFRLAACLTKGDKGRTIRIPKRLLHELRSYIAVERARAAEKFKLRQGWRSILGAIPCRPGSRTGQLQVQADGARWVAMSLDRLRPDERRRLLLTDGAGGPQAPAALWLTETGQPVAPNSWEVAFARAGRCCRTAGFPITVSPHQLRHTFSVQMLALLMRERPGDVGGGAHRLVLDEALQELRRLLGHASLTTTYRYINRLPRSDATADAAIEELIRTLDPVPSDLA